MTVLLLLFAALGAYGVVATIAAVRSDGYGPVPTRRY